MSVIFAPHLTRRRWLAAAASLAGVGLSNAQQQAQEPAACVATKPDDGFAGRIGRTADDSMSAPLSTPTANPASPNIIYILLDDTGFADLHCYGSEAATPHIDALAAQGLLYTQFHSKAICSPTRASLLTGRNNHAVGMRQLAEEDRGFPHSRGRIPSSAATVAQVLQASGYSTYGVGKWHLAPREDFGPGGRKQHWPLQKGFDRFYGFLSGWTDQYNPDLFEDNHTLPKPNRPGYHFSEDIIQRAMDWIGGHVDTAPRKPFFQYIAFGATHSPVQVPKHYIDKYVSTYQQGWDAIREGRYRRQLELGIIPPNTKLPPRNPGDPAWDSLTARDREIFTRFMAAYAGFMEHTDAQIGRLVAFLKQRGLFENTVIFLMSDNGGAPEAGNKGGFQRPYGDPTTLDQMHARLEELGQPGTQPMYQRAWASASVAPFQFYKLWPYRGGVQTPCIVSWPKGIQQPGIRRQFLDVIDITPTALDVAGIAAPTAFQGVCQLPMHGNSMRATFNNPDAPSPRDTQFFELWGSRSIYHQGWKAIGIHRPGTSFDDDRWELYHVAEDFSESTNLASQYPQRLDALKQLWWEEATRYGALPLLEAIPGRGNTYNQALEP
ncbi:MAG: arylsulfatase [Bryobacterales bacterium]|jgi:arylsulfatase|nr:arylsulfatase [Bryobacterales bacterium]